MMYSPEVGSRWWMSATRPASEFSIGIRARSTSPSTTAANTSSNVAYGTVACSGQACSQATCEFEPGSP